MRQLAELIKELKSGNNDCLKVIFKNYSQYCIQKLQKHSRCSLEDAEDIFMDAVINFREKIIEDKIDHNVNVKGYLLSTCKNMYLQKCRKKQRTKQLLSGFATYYYNEMEQYPEIKDSAYHNQKLLDVVCTALNHLNGRCEDILNYFYIDKLRMSEIAEKMNLASADVAKTTKMRCFKELIKKVRELMQKEEEVKND